MKSDKFEGMGTYLLLAVNTPLICLKREELLTREAEPGSLKRSWVAERTHNDFLFLSGEL